MTAQEKFLAQQFNNSGAVTGGWYINAKFQSKYNWYTGETLKIGIKTMTVYCMTCNSIKTETDHVYSIFIHVLVLVLSL